MEHGPRTPERLEERPRPAFDLERMDTELIVRLVTIVEAASIDETESEGERSKGGELLAALLGRDVASLPERDLEKAKEVYFALASHEEPSARVCAADTFGELLRHLPADDYQVRQQAIDAWVKLLNDKDGLVSAVGLHALYDADQSGLLDEAVLRYLDSKSPEL